MVNFQCNTTLETLRISNELPIAGRFSFHELGLMIAGGCAAFSIILSLYLLFMHATHYTKPYEQRHIIRILLMIPVYSAASFLSFWFYWHAIYFTVISACYEAFAIASFFALLCHYIAPDLHNQKEYFRSLHSVKPWVWPVTWALKCCGGERGIWRTPRSGLTWFNIVWFGIYQYCFIRVAMTIVAVITEYFGRYCESSNEPWFAHIWVLVIEGASVTVAMFCVIQFYLQLRHDLADHGPFLKVLAIKLVIFLSFWQSFVISILISSTLNIIHPTDTIQYPDIAVGIPALLLCIEMAIFSILHIFAYPYKPYVTGRAAGKYPVSSEDQSVREIGPNQGGFMGIKALGDALNPWDLVKAFARGMRWIFVGRRHREQDLSYKIGANDMALGETGTTDTSYKGPGGDGLPLATEFRRDQFGVQSDFEEGAGLISHAQQNPNIGDHFNEPPSPVSYGPTGGNGFNGSQDFHSTATSGQRYDSRSQAQTQGQGIGMASSGLVDDERDHPSWSGVHESQDRNKVQRYQGTGGGSGSDSPQAGVHQMMWGSNPSQQHQQGGPGQSQESHNQSSMPFTQTSTPYGGYDTRGDAPNWRG